MKIFVAIAFVLGAVTVAQVDQLFFFFVNSKLGFH